MRMQLSLLSIRIHIMLLLTASTQLLNAVIAHVAPSAYEVISVLDIEIVVPTSSKHKKTLSIVEHYYSDHTY
jgi:hypothetical protein